MTRDIEAPLIRWFAEIGIDDVARSAARMPPSARLCRELAPKGVKVPERIRGDRRWLPALSELGRARAIDRAGARRSRCARRRGSPAARAAGAACDFGSEPAGGARARHHGGVRPPGRTELGADRRGRAEQRHGRGPARRQLRRPAGDVPQRAGPRGAARALQALLRVAVHRSGDLLSRRQGLRSLQVALSIGVQKMVRSDLGASGVMFSIDTETGFRDAVLINAAYGLGENVVQGAVEPDEYYVFKPTLEAGLSPDPAKEGSARRSSSWSTTSGGRQMTRTCPCRRRTRAVRAHRRRHPDAGPLGAASSKTTTRASAAGRRRWTWSGPRTGGPASCSSCRRGPKPCSRQGARCARSLPAHREAGAVLVDGPQRRREDRPADRCASIRDAAVLRAFRTARCWSPTRPIPTGSRS